MLHTDERFSDAVEACVRDIEQETDAELVIVAAARSDSYQDVSLFIGAICALITLFVVLFAPIVVHPLMVPVDVIIGGALGYFVGRSPWLLGHVVSGRRRLRHVQRAARAEFVNEAVHATPQRSGVLVYASALEGLVVVVPDVGIEGMVPLASWTRATNGLSASSTDAFTAGLRELGTLLAAAVPHIDREDRVALSDTPRIRS